MVVVLGVLLVGCASPGLRLHRAEAEIAEMRRDCLKRKQVDPALDCSQYQRALLEIRDTR